MLLFLLALLLVFVLARVCGRVILAAVVVDAAGVVVVVAVVAGAVSKEVAAGAAASEQQQVVKPALGAFTSIHSQLRVISQASTAKTT